MSPPFDVAIVGAGIVGAACARECAREGLRVAVIDPSSVVGGATAAGMGHVVVMDDSAAQLALTLYSRALWAELSAELPREAEVDRCGTVWVAAGEREMAAAARKKTVYEQAGSAAELLDARALSEAEPNLRAALAGGLRVPGDLVVYPPCAARYLLERACERRAELYPRRAVELNEAGVRLDDGSIVAAGAVVNAAGCWAPLLTPGIDVRKRKGHLVITGRYPGFVRHQLVELGYLESAHASTSDSVAFNVQPRRSGQVLIGSSRQFGVETDEVDAAVVARMVARACEYMPGLSRLDALRAWTGFRAATPDNLPLIGPHPGRKGLWLATGHEGLGITTSLGTARLLVDQLLGRAPAIPVHPYLPARLVSGESGESREFGDRLPIP